VVNTVHPILTLVLRHRPFLGSQHRQHGLQGPQTDEATLWDAEITIPYHEVVADLDLRFGSARSHHLFRRNLELVHQALLLFTAPFQSTIVPNLSRHMSQRKAESGIQC